MADAGAGAGAAGGGAAGGATGSAADKVMIITQDDSGPRHGYSLMFRLSSRCPDSLARGVQHSWFVRKDITIRVLLTWIEEEIIRKEWFAKYEPDVATFVIMCVRWIIGNGDPDVRFGVRKKRKVTTQSDEERARAHKAAEHEAAFKQELMQEFEALLKTPESDWPDSWPELYTAFRSAEDSPRERVNRPEPSPACKDFSALVFLIMNIEDKLDGTLIAPEHVSTMGTMVVYMSAVRREFLNNFHAWTLEGGDCKPLSCRPELNPSGK